MLVAQPCPVQQQFRGDGEGELDFPAIDLCAVGVLGPCGHGAHPHAACAGLARGENRLQVEFPHIDALELDLTGEP